eukprot:2528837-Rhodomonas_salina.1
MAGCREDRSFDNCDQHWTAEMFGGASLSHSHAQVSFNAQLWMACAHIMLQQSMRSPGVVCETCLQWSKIALHSWKSGLRAKFWARRPPRKCPAQRCCVPHVRLKLRLDRPVSAPSIFGVSLASRSSRS